MVDWKGVRMPLCRLIHSSKVGAFSKNRTSVCYMVGPFFVFAGRLQRNGCCLLQMGSIWRCRKTAGLIAEFHSSRTLCPRCSRREHSDVSGGAAHQTATVYGQPSFCPVGTSVHFFSQATVSCKNILVCNYCPTLSAQASSQSKCYVSMHEGGRGIVFPAHWHKILCGIIPGFFGNQLLR